MNTLGGTAYTLYISIYVATCKTFWKSKKRISKRSCELLQSSKVSGLEYLTIPDITQTWP